MYLVGEATLYILAPIKAYFADLEVEHTFADNTWTLYPANSVRTFSAGEDRRTGIYDAGRYQAHDLSYLAEESGWMGNVPMLYAASASTRLTPLLEDAYRSAQPVMAAGSDGICAAFLRADAVSGDVYAAAIKRDGNGWKEPVRADASAVMDNAPSLCVGQDGTVWLAYASTGQGYHSGSALADYARNQSIVVGKIDPATLALTKMAEYPGSGYVHLQQLEMVNGVPALAWVDSAVTDDNSVLWPASGTVYTASYTNGSWGGAV